MNVKLSHIFEEIISVDNLLFAWKEFEKGKKNKIDVLKFSERLMDNILSLHYDLASRTYAHGGYKAFKISDPKPRDIHKASVLDRLLHHAIYRVAYPYFDRKFICDSYSCRNGKGTHKAMSRFKQYHNEVSKNNTRTCWVLKCDIRKFFANIDHQILRDILEKHIEDEDLMWLLGEVVGSFNTEGKTGKGLPLGNLTSQLLVNIYMNEFDQYMKHVLKVKWYIRYADDFCMLSGNKKELEQLLSQTGDILKGKLELELHPDKVSIKTFSSGVDFLGWVHFPAYSVLRTSTKRRMMERIRKRLNDETVGSYLGMLKHGNGHLIREEIVSIQNGASGWIPSANKV
ncbi:hypothetical protein A2524_01095 [Candidatus Wolfebacteria bacterium RIFOXYD12_FULL_48_21]|uniref:Reverse transcriptase domain-containing protein n=1 Tax=Candidatus Wolfebacteria bacterium RIFOXYD1_FULL_48_65 TaxID=1802561 RepID=A0A1F8E0E6_9BACT|nr:MAG: hypothetical protein A2610_03040 [Candidatus Wolfebacteria bacterium RIFOXYD1_FULL_48_65]OGM94405.1 MAG: hypothetical protein A2524_01095 [Candidatus Wolfebacteria bacterium RIFOXYD12_FULL_48_21]OGM97612.1 MAG: hypothetical protein A2532_00095 [Candidatus Wolfebacteria bacterium RIFOXYD2_FULL_48_11]